MRNEQKTVLILVGVTFLVTLLFLGIIIYSFFATSNSKLGQLTPTPTPVPYQRDANGKFVFTPLTKTEVGVTTARDVEKNQTVISKTIAGDITTYVVKSQSPGDTDEIKTQNGTVIFESDNIFNKIAGYPPKLDVYRKEFGEPEKTIENVSPLGHLTAYIYAKKGFTLFINPYTHTVYEVQRYVPTTVENYEKAYPEFLQPAPTPEPDYFTAAP